MDTGGTAEDQLRSLVERYNRLQQEIDQLNKDRSELMKQVAALSAEIRNDLRREIGEEEAPAL